MASTKAPMSPPPGLSGGPPPGLSPPPMKATLASNPAIALPPLPPAAMRDDEVETVVPTPPPPIMMAQQQQQQQQQERQQRRENSAPRTFEHAHLPRFPASTCMSGRDIALVVRSQMKVFETADVYRSDYYAHRFVALQKRRQDTSLVRPVWEDQRANIKNREAHLLADQKIITHKWEEGHRVLGHVQKSDITRPRAILGVGAAEVGLTRTAPFSSSLWAARRAVDAGLIALLALEETRHYGSSMLQQNQQGIDANIANQLMAQAESRLIAIVTAVAGTTNTTDHIRPHPVDIEPNALAIASGLSSDNIRLCQTFPDNDHPFRTSTLEALLAMTKGVKLLARVARALPHTSTSSSLVNTALAAFRNRSTQDIDFARYDTNLAQVLETHVLPRTSLPALVDFAITYAELSAEPIPQYAKHETDASPSPLKIMSQAILSAGDSIAPNADPQSAQRWNQARQAIIASS